MALILYIETATEVCSAALAENGKLIAEKHSSEPRLHAQLLTIYIDQLLKDAGYSYKHLDAVCVSKGPGSYTGLRIGVAVAKGLCFALEKPLIAVNTLSSMTASMNKRLQEKSMPDQAELLFCPMIDARRMEVYTAIFDSNNKEIFPTKAIVLNQESFMEYKNHKLIFFGDGAIKLKDLKPVLDAIFIDDFQCSATGMIMEGTLKYINGQFEDIAYFEPFYLKEFVGNKGH